MVTGRLARRPIQFERHWPGDPTTGQRGGSTATAPPALDVPSPIPQPGTLKLSTQVDLRYFCDRLYRVTNLRLPSCHTAAIAVFILHVIRSPLQSRAKQLHSEIVTLTITRSAQLTRDRPDLEARAQWSTQLGAPGAGEGERGVTTGALSLTLLAGRGRARYILVGDRCPASQLPSPEHPP